MMVSDEQLREALRREAFSHEPDLTQIRSRFESGRLSSLDDPDREQATRVHGESRRKRTQDLAGVTQRHWLAPVLRPAALVAAVVCAVTVLTHASALTSLVHDSNKAGSAASTIAPTPSGSTDGASPSESVKASSPPRSGTRATPKIGVPVTAHHVSRQVMCGTYAGTPLAPYFLANDLWAAELGTGTQCSQALSAPGQTVSWATNWSWSGGPGHVKSFASVELGWHWGWPMKKTVLPVKVDALRSARTKWDFTVTHRAASNFNISYDLWFHNTAQPVSDTQPTAEMLIVLNQVGAGYVPSQAVGKYFIDGTFWDLYEGKNGWEVYTFVRETPTTSSDIDLKNFIDVTRLAGAPGTFDYLSSVEAGADVVTGIGRLSTSAYSVRIN